MPSSGETLVEIFLSRAFSTPDRVAFRAKRGGLWEPLSFREYHDQAREVANALLSAGTSKGARVAIVSGNRPEWLICDMATMLAGAVTVPVYPSNSPPQVAQVIAHSQAAVAIVEDDSQLQKVLEVRADLPDLQTIVVMSSQGAHPDAAVSLADFKRRGVKYEQSEPTELDDRIRSAAPADLASIVYTSGTTGEPKGVMLTHANFVWTTRAVEAFIQLNEGERLISYLPLSHIFERLISTALGASFGFEIWFAESTAALLHNLKDCRPTVFVGVPRVYEKFYTGLKDKIAANPKRKIIEKAIETGREKFERSQKGRVPPVLRLRARLLDKVVLSKVREGLGMDRVRFAITGAAPIDAEIIKFIHAIGIELLDGYGQTETTAPISLNPPGKARLGSVGLPLPGVEVAFEDDGEILVKGGNVFAGYFRDEAATAAAMTGRGFLKTGDVGALDGDGYLRISDRKKDLFKTSGGKFVAPQLIEGRLTLEPLIGQAVVVGDRRPYPSALLTLDEEAAAKWAADRGLESAGPRDLAGHPDLRAAIASAVARVNATLSRPEQIKKWTLLPAVFTQEAGEITPTLKVRRAAVTAKYSEQIEAMYG